MSGRASWDDLPDVRVDLSRPLSLAIELDPQGEQPRHFGAPPARAEPWVVPGFSGAVATGSSCNCSRLTLIPHCNGTHTESVGHLTREAWPVHRVAPGALLPATLLSLRPIAAGTAAGAGEDTDPLPQPGD